MPSDWKGVGPFGPRLTTVRCRSRIFGSPTCSRASTGGIRSGSSDPSWLRMISRVALGVLLLRVD